MSSLSFDVVRRGGNGGGERPQPGSLYRSPQVFEMLWPLMQAEGNASSNAVLFSTSKLLFWEDMEKKITSLVVLVWLDIHLTLKRFFSDELQYAYR